MSKLNVFYENQKVGQLARDSELIYSFTYDRSWLESPNSFQLSLILPLQSQPFGNRLTLSFFENLLPEGEVKEVLGKDHQITGPFEFLHKFGKDCAGAIVLTPEDKPPYSKNHRGEVKINLEHIDKAIEEKRSVAEVISEMEPGYLSLAGAQDKFPAIYRNKGLYLPTNGYPTTHIIKVPIWRMGVKESVYNEYYCMNLAKSVGLTVPDCLVLKDGKHPLFITERYDRIVEKNAVIHRLHQQDFCQAQGIVCENKYEEKGGPTIEDNYLLIKKNTWIKKRVKDSFAFLDWICFNLLIGNNDSHSKNISLLLKDQKIELAPFYDLLCTAIYPKLKQQFSFKIGDRNDVSKIGKNQFDLLDRKLGLKLGLMSERIVQMRDKLLKNKDEIAEQVLQEHPNVKIPKRISELIEKRCRSLSRQRI